jgi:hypothetical protein
MEVVENGRSNKYYAEGTPTTVEYKDEDGNSRTGMVITCPRCNGSGKNTSKTLNRLHGAHNIPRDKRDTFGGGCHTPRVDAVCVGGLMADRATGEIVYPHNEYYDKFNTNEAEFDRQHPRLIEFVRRRALESDKPEGSIRLLDLIMAGQISRDKINHIYKLKGDQEKLDRMTPEELEFHKEYVVNKKKDDRQRSTSKPVGMK